MNPQELPLENRAPSTGSRAMNAKITDLARWKAEHLKPINDACRWSEAIESVMTTNLRVVFAWQRTVLRAWGIR